MVTKLKTERMEQYEATAAKVGATVSRDSERVHITLGRHTCSFPIDVEDPLSTFSKQLRNVVSEHTRAPMTPEEAAAWRHGELMKAAALLRGEHARAEQERYDAFDDDERAEHEYFAKHGEPCYFMHAKRFGDPLDALVGAEELGIYIHEAEAERLRAWKARSEARRS